MSATSLAARLWKPLRGLDHAAGRRTGTLRVLVDVRTPMNLAVLRPIWKALRADPRVSIAFVAETHSGVAEALATDGLAESLITHAEAKWRRWDLAVSADAWNHAALRRCRRLLNLFHGVAGKYDLDNPARLGADLRHFDRVAFINAERMERYRQAGAVRQEQAVLVGYPKADDLFCGALNPSAIRRSLGLDPGRRTVAYAPTFSTAGSLHLAGPAIVRALLETNVNVIVKLHDRSLTPHPRYTDGIDWRERLSAFSASPRFALSRDADAGPSLAAADVLVTDHSTVGFEFAALDRPVIVYDAPELLHAARIDPDKWTLLREMAAVVRSPAELTTTLAHLDPARHRAARQQARALFAFPGRATERALSVVYELLEIAPLAAPGHAGHDHTSRPITEAIGA